MIMGVVVSGDEKLTEMESSRIVGRLKKEAAIFFKDTSENYRQKLIYTLLNSIKSQDRGRFLQTLLRATNSGTRDNIEGQGFVATMCQSYELWSEALFERCAYAIILGIMSANNSINNDVNYGGRE
jgi:hypothetical protein